MVQFTLPRNSKIKTGKIWNRPESKGKRKEFRVYRWNPEDGENPRIDGYWINLAECGPMVLDGLIKIKERDQLDADVPPLLPRGHLRLLRHEYRRDQHARLHPGDRQRSEPV